MFIANCNQLSVIVDGLCSSEVGLEFSAVRASCSSCGSEVLEVGRQGCWHRHFSDN